MSIIITSNNQVVQERIIKVIRKMIAKSLIPDESLCIDDQAKEMQSWSNEAMDSIERVLSSIPDTKDVELK